MKSKQLPKLIYLQWHGSADRNETGHRCDDSGVTWCRDRIFKADYVYMLIRRKRKRTKP